jgi:DNA polymerase-4
VSKTIMRVWRDSRFSGSKRVWKFPSTQKSFVSPANARQLDLLLNDDRKGRQCEVITNTVDGLNRKFGKRVVTVGAWTPPPGGYAGGKIAYNRIPSAEDFW